jgi:hypothetical protein
MPADPSACSPGVPQITFLCILHPVWGTCLFHDHGRWSDALVDESLIKYKNYLSKVWRAPCVCVFTQ